MQESPLLVSIHCVQCNCIFLTIPCAELKEHMKQVVAMQKHTTSVITGGKGETLHRLELNKNQISRL